MTHIVKLLWVEYLKLGFPFVILYSYFMLIGHGPLLSFYMEPISLQLLVTE